jgi:hypothetical protein
MGANVSPWCLARSTDGEFLFSATTDGQCVHRWQVGPPRAWSRGTHARFPARAYTRPLFGST